MSKDTNIGQNILDAARSKQQLILEQILQKNRDPIPVITDDSKQTALHWAVMNNMPSIIKLLLLHNFNKNLLNKDYHTPIVLAAKLNFWQCVATFIHYDKANFTGGLDAVLLYAVKEKEFIIVKELLALGAPCDARWTDTQFTALHWAVENQDIDMIYLLLTYQANQKLKDNSNSTALRRACDNAYWQCVIALCQPSSLPTEKDLNEALLFACQANQYQAAKALLMAGADPNACQSHEGRSPLHWAVFYNSPELFAILIGHKARTNVTDKAKNTPLAIAVELNHTQIAHWIKPLNIDEVISHDGLEKLSIDDFALKLGDRNNFSKALHSENLMPSPICVAIAQNNLNAVKELIAAGEKLEAPIHLKGKNFLEYAIELEQCEIISEITQAFKGNSLIEKSFLNACKNEQWQSARAIDNERAIAIELDTKFYKKLSCLSLSNTKVKADFMQDANLQAERLPCDKSVLYQHLAKSKTATYRQFMFWSNEPTKTTTFFNHQKPLKLT